MGLRPHPRPRLKLRLGLGSLRKGRHLFGPMGGELAGIGHEPSSVRFGAGAPAACLVILGRLALCLCLLLCLLELWGLWGLL